MKIPLQEKIAELESRIAKLESRVEALEKQRHVTVTTVTEETTTTIKGRVLGKHWNKMWDEFHLAMKEIFE